jgi:alkylated DNA nucleotide flippase Atl1
MEYFSSAELWKIALLFFAAASLMLSTWIGTQALFPKFVRQAQETYDRPGKNFLIGIVSLLVLGGVSGAIAKLGGVGALLGGLVGSALLLLALAGAAGLARRIGSGMQHPTDKDQPWRRTMRGGVILLGTMLVPIVNVVPLTLILACGLGAGIMALRKIRSEQRAAGGTDE